MGVDFLLRNGKKILIFGLLMAALALATTTLFSYIGTQVAIVLNNFGLSFLPIFAPSNLSTCTAIVVSVKIAGTLYETTMQLLKWKVDTLA